MFGGEPLDALARRVGVARTSRNHVHGRMCHHLAGWTAILKPYRERLRLELADLGDQFPDGGLLRAGWVRIPPPTPKKPNKLDPFPQPRVSRWRRSWIPLHLSGARTCVLPAGVPMLTEPRATRKVRTQVIGQAESQRHQSEGRVSPTYGGKDAASNDVEIS